MTTELGPSSDGHRHNRGGAGRRRNVLGCFPWSGPTRSLQQFLQPHPEKLVARIALDPARLLTVLDQHEGRRVVDRRMDNGWIATVVEIDLPDRRAEIELGLRIDRPDLAIPLRAPRTAVAAEHDEFGGVRCTCNQNGNTHERGDSEAYGEP